MARESVKYNVSGRRRPCTKCKHSLSIDRFSLWSIELLFQKADLVIGPFTISSSRQTVIDFTQPYMDVGLSIIMRKEEDSKYKVFSFLRPFDFNLWLAIVSTTLGVGVFLWLHSTFNPYGYHGRVAQARDKTNVTTDQIKTKDHLRFFNAIWSSFAYYVSQGPDVLHPISLSGRIAVGVWWFAVLIIGKRMKGWLRVKHTRPG